MAALTFGLGGLMRTAEAIELLIVSRRAAGCRPRTIGFYREQLGLLSRVAVELPETAGPLRELLADRVGSAATRHALYRALRALYGQLVGDGVIVVNPMVRVVAPRVPRQAQRTLDRGDVVRLLALRLSPRDRAVLVVLLDTGIRAGELRNLRGRDLRDGSVVVAGKSGERVVPAGVETIALARSLVRDVGEPVFRSRGGGAMCERSLYRVVSRALGRAGLGGVKVGPHMLRHTFGRHWVTSGGDVASLQRVLGHASMSTTQVYVSLSAADLGKAHGEYSLLTRPVRLRLVV